MIPLKDENPSGTTPVVTYVIIATCVVAFGYEVLQGSRLDSLIASYGVVPANYAPRNVVQTPREGGLLLPLLTCMFLHGGFVHLLGNMWYLWIFGDNVEDRLGHFRFLFFYVACGLIATFAHIMLNRGSGVPVIGASGAIAGVLGAYLVSFPRARVLVLIPLWFYFPVVLFPAFIVLGLWFALQFGNGLLSVTASARNVGGVAWWAHIGGFVAGIFLVKVIPKRRKRRRKPVRYKRTYPVDTRW